MTKDELKKKLKKSKLYDFEVSIFCDLFEKEINVNIESNLLRKEKMVVSDFLLENILAVKKFGNSDMEKLKSDIFENYKMTIEYTSYSGDTFIDELVKKHNGDEVKANQEYFNINNPEEVFNSLDLIGAEIRESIEIENSNCTCIYIESPWDDEHELCILFEKGKYKLIE